MSRVQVMGITPQIVDDFLDAIKGSVQAIRDKNYTECKRHAERAQRCGQLLAIQPAFGRALTVRCPGFDPASAVNAVAHVLLSLASIEGEPPREPFILTPTSHNGQHSA